MSLAPLLSSTRLRARSVGLNADLLNQLPIGRHLHANPVAELQVLPFPFGTGRSHDPRMRDIDAPFGTSCSKEGTGGGGSGFRRMCRSTMRALQVAIFRKAATAVDALKHFRQSLPPGSAIYSPGRADSAIAVTGTNRPGASSCMAAGRCAAIRPCPPITRRRGHIGWQAARRQGRVAERHQGATRRGAAWAWCAAPHRASI
jgi:hypothetical protein